METPKDFEGKPIVRICSYCQQINNPDMVVFAKGIDPKIKDEMKSVDKKVKENRDKFTFTHTVCVPHLTQNLERIPGMTKERIRSMVEKSEQGNPVPCLLVNEPLRHAYMRGLFTQEQIQQAVQSQKQDNQNLTERFKILAGIKS